MNDKTDIIQPQPTITNKEIIDALKSLGFSVKITHSRVCGNLLLKNADIKILTKAMKIMNGDSGHKYNLVNAKGGLTHITVKKGDQTWEAEAKCSVKDAFVYRKATQLALYRVLKVVSDTQKDVESLKSEVENVLSLK